MGEIEIVAQEDRTTSDFSKFTTPEKVREREPDEKYTKNAIDGNGIFFTLRFAPVSGNINFYIARKQMETSCYVHIVVLYMYDGRADSDAMYGTRK